MAAEWIENLGIEETTTDEELSDMAENIDKLDGKNNTDTLEQLISYRDSLKK